MLDFTDNQIEDALLRARIGLDRYVRIMDIFSNTNVSIDREFQRTFKGFYKIRRNDEFCDNYFSYMEEHRKNIPSFCETLNFFFDEFEMIEASYTSKLLATLNPNLPVWDKYVLNNLNIRAPGFWLSKQERIKRIKNIYDEIVNWYKDAVDSDKGRRLIEAINNKYTEYKNCVTSVKKIDLILWQIR